MKLAVLLFTLAIFASIGVASFIASRRADEQQDRIMFRYCVALAAIGVGIVVYLSWVRFMEGKL